MLADAATVTECADGFYRIDWAPATPATACTPCGTGISSEGTENLAVFNGVTNVLATYQKVRGATGSCCKFCRCCKLEE